MTSVAEDQVQRLLQEVKATESPATQQGSVRWRMALGGGLLLLGFLLLLMGGPLVTSQGAAKLRKSQVLQSLALVEGRPVGHDQHHQAPVKLEEELFAKLPLGSALVEFVKTGDLKIHNGTIGASYAAFVLSNPTGSTSCGAAGLLELLDLGSANEIHELIEQFTRAVSLPERDPNASFVPPPLALLAGQKLWNLLLKPVLDRLPGVKHLFLAPDGKLVHLPFAALPVELPRGARPGYVIHQDFTISYLTAGRDLLQKRGCLPEGSARICRIITDPDYGAMVNAGGATTVRRVQERAGFTQLKSTKDEGISIKKALQEHAKIDSYEGESATVDAVLNADLSPPWVLHIATHGFCIPEAKEAQSQDRLVLAVSNMKEPLVRCGLAFAGAQTWYEGRSGESGCSGIATGLMLQHLNLKGTKLVTLSACETGLGQAHLNEGVFGLGRAMKLAGASSVVMSLWTIDDKWTAELMKEFYQRLVEDPKAQGPFHLAVALRDAQRSLCDRSGRSTPRPWHPWYWGAFTVQGAVGSIM